jgi:eukaryotic-like serine/threonine-protein kinase
VTQSGRAEVEIQAWLDTIVAASTVTKPTAPPSTIVPRERDLSARRAKEFLTQLGERGRPVELRVGKVIGEGGMGMVREAEQVALGRTVAIKTLKPGSANAAAAADLLREAWITGALEHPNVVPVHHLELDDDLRPLLILKRVDGVEWSALCHDAGEVERRFGATDVLAWNLGIMGQVLNALRFAHARGVVHRDLKPSNVMIGSFGEVYLLDWGIAVSLRDDGTGRFPLAADATELAGTPSYMAPEMLMHEGGAALSERTDVYLAGAVLFELITGAPPHRGPNALAVISSVVMSRPILPADVPPELVQICARAMQPDPADRFESIEALQLALAHYLEHRGSERLTRGATTRLAELIATAAGGDPAQREELYRQLAICRFAFHEALAAWRANADAQAGLRQAAIAVAQYELACGDPNAAVALLSELEDRPALLDQAQAAVAAQAERRERLEQLDRDNDPTVHTRTRSMAVALGIVFTILPAISALVPWASVDSPARQVGWAAGALAMLFVLSFALRGRNMSPINRRVYTATQFLFATQLILAIGGWILGISPSHIQVLNLFLWGTLFGMFALAIDRWMAIASAGYLAGFLIAANSPEHRMWVMSACNLFMTLVIAWRWRTTAERLAADAARVRAQTP